VSPAPRPGTSHGTTTRSRNPMIAKSDRGSQQRGSPGLAAARPAGAAMTCAAGQAP
jgi:hypothetical protein